MSTSDPLRAFAAYLRREAKRRAEGAHPGVVRLRDDELAALLVLLKQEVEIEGALQ